LTEGINEQRNVIRAAIITASEEILGVVDKPMIKELFDNKCEAATREKSKAYI
jgi:hypothetical protein